MKTHKKNLCVWKKFKNAHRIQPFSASETNVRMKHANAIETNEMTTCLMRMEQHTQAFAYTHKHTHTHQCTHSSTQKHTTTDCARCYILLKYAHYHHITTICACDYRARSICCWLLLLCFCLFLLLFYFRKWWTNFVLCCSPVCACVLVSRSVYVCVCMCAIVKAFWTGFMQLHT